MTNANSIQTEEAMTSKIFVKGAFGYRCDDTKFDFLVNPDIDPKAANSRAWALESAVRDLICESVGGALKMDANLSFLCAHALDTAIGLRDVAGSND